LWRRHDYVDRIKLFESDKWPKLPQNVAARQVPHQHPDDTETKYTITRRYAWIVAFGRVRISGRCNRFKTRAWRLARRAAASS
jgi:hypothetical protein